MRKQVQGNIFCATVSLRVSIQFQISKGSSYLQKEIKKTYIKCIAHLIQIQFVYTEHHNGLKL